VRGRKLFGLIALFLVLALVGTACQQAQTPEEPAAEEGEPGGTLVFAAEQYPLCLNPITQCYNASWLHYISTLEVLPQLLIYDEDNNYKPGIVKEIPSLDNGGVTESPFTITYEIEEDAVWEDGTPITGNDVKFTLDAIMKSAKSIFSKGVGYDKITEIKIDSSNPKKFGIVLSEESATWKELFSGSYYVLKAAAFGGDPEISEKMQTDLAGICGNAWCLESFSESELVLVRNEKYWKKKALLDKIVFKKIEEQPAEINSFKTGEIQAFYPQPTTELVEQIKAIPGGEINVKSGTVYEGLWFNLDKAPVNEKPVREALLLGLDRQKAIDTIVKPVQEDATVNHCTLNVPGNAGGKWCPKVMPTKPDVAAANKALDDAGWVKGADGIRAKAGKRLTIPLATSAGNVGREQFQTILQAQAKELGIELTADNSPATTLFQTRLPARDFTVFMAAQVAPPDPSVTHIVSSEQIAPAGQNYYGVNDKELDTLLKASDAEIDEDKRVEIMKDINEKLREIVMAVPLYAKPQILVYNSERLGGSFDFNAGQAAFAHSLKTWYFKNEADRNAS
jgi:peptide/nickel transport system substrate-binding protein